MQTGDASTAGGLVATNTVCINCVNGAALIQSSSAERQCGRRRRERCRRPGRIRQWHDPVQCGRGLGDRRRQQCARRVHRHAEHSRTAPAQIASSSASGGSVTSTGSEQHRRRICRPDRRHHPRPRASSGPVTGTSDSYLGGFAGVNLGTDRSNPLPPPRHPSPALATATSSAASSAPISAASTPPPRPATPPGATDSAVGAFAGANATFVNFSGRRQFRTRASPTGPSPIRPPPARPVVAPGSTVDPFIALVNPTTAAQPAGISLDHLRLHRSHMRCS